jgi:hypothetical protein
MKLGHPGVVASKCDKFAPCGSVLLVPTKMARTDGSSVKYSSKAAFISFAYRVSDRLYVADVVFTKSSTSWNGCSDTIYTVWSGGTGEVESAAWLASAAR